MSKLKIFTKTRDPQSVQYRRCKSSIFGAHEKIKSWKSLSNPPKTMFIFQFPAKNMLIMALFKMDHTECSQIQTFPGNISHHSLFEDRGSPDCPVQILIPLFGLKPFDPHGRQCVDIQFQVFQSIVSSIMGSVGVYFNHPFLNPHNTLQLQI